MRGAFDETKIPTESELMRDYALPRVVVREAFALLQEAGLIGRLQGHGTYTLPAPTVDTVNTVFGLDGPDRPARFWTPATHSRLLTREKVRTPAAVGYLMPNAGDEVLVVDYLTYYGATVVAVATNYFAYPQAERVEQVPLGPNFYDFLRDGGLEIGHDELWIGAAQVDRNLERVFEIPAGRPLLTFQQRIYDPEGEIFDIAFVSLRADRLMLHSQNSPRTEHPA